MIKLIYILPADRCESETAWLREQKIFPASEIYYDFFVDKKFVKFGIIVNEEQALTVKLRNKITLQDTYKQR